MAQRLLTLASGFILATAVAVACSSGGSSEDGSGGTPSAGGAAGGGATGGGSGGTDASLGGSSGGGGMAGGGGMEPIDARPDYGPVPTCAEMCPIIRAAPCLAGITEPMCLMLCQENLDGPCSFLWGQLLACAHPDGQVTCDANDQPTYAGCFEAEDEFETCAEMAEFDGGAGGAGGGGGSGP